MGSAVDHNGLMGTLREFMGQNKYPDKKATCLWRLRLHWEMVLVKQHVDSLRVNKERRLGKIL